MNRITALLGLSLFLFNSQQVFAPAVSSPTRQTPPGKSIKGAAAKKDCNAFEVWSQLSQEKRPDPPSAVLDSALKEGQRLPSGEEERQLNRWMQMMAPIVAITKAGCACSKANIAYKPFGERSLEFLKLSYACKVHQIKAKQFMAAGQFSNVPSEIGEIFSICRTAFSSKPVAVEFLIYTSLLRQGLASIRECLHWRNCPDAILSELPALMDGIDDRKCAVHAIKEECEFMVSQLTNECQSGDFLKTTDESFGINLAHSKGNVAVLKSILQKRTKDFDLNGTIALFREVAAESEKNAMLPINVRQESRMNSLRKELQPLIEAFKEDNSPLLALVGEFTLSNRLAKVNNLLGKVIVLDVLSREPNGPDFFNTIVENEDRSVMEMEGTKILVALSRYERAKHELPKSLDSIAVDLHPEKCEGYVLTYSKESRTLQFKPIQKSLHKTADGKDHLAWSIPHPES